MTLKKGKNCPVFSLENQHGETVRLEDYLFRHNIVLYFYPQDDTGGCTREACAFRDRLQEFESLGAVVFGISPDSVASHAEFARKHQLNFSILADPGRQVARKFGIVFPLLPIFPRRVTFIVDKQGKIVNSHEKLLDAGSHLAFARKELEGLL